MCINFLNIIKYHYFCRHEKKWNTYIKGIIFKCLPGHLPGVATPWGGYSVEGQSARSCMILVEANPLSSYHIKFSFTFIHSVFTRSSLACSWFQRPITLSRKKYFRRSRLQRCFTGLTEWPLVDDGELSKSDPQSGLDFPINI